MERETNTFYVMKQLPDFDLSIIMPLGNQIEEFVRTLPFKVKYFERNGIEIILILDKRIACKDLLDYIQKHPFISWKVVFGSTESEPLLSLVQAFNIGIQQATKQYVLLMNPESEFCTDVICDLREKLDVYPGHYVIGQSLFWNNQEEINIQQMEEYCDNLLSYGCTMVKREYLVKIGGYDDRYVNWEECEENLRRRLELLGICRLFLPEAVLIRREEGELHRKWQETLSGEMLSEILLPVEIVANSKKSKEHLGTVIYDWQEHFYARQQCKDYLSKLKQFDILSDRIFDVFYPLVALIPTYNESDRITDCLRSVEKYCDGIILLDDDSVDDTYQIVQSDKLLVKAKKIRTEFNDVLNRNILLNIASFFKAGWFIFIDADERFDDRFVDLREIMKKTDVDTVGVWIVNLWDSMETYRIDMEDTNPCSKNGLWFRWRMFKNRGRTQLISQRKLHFPSVPYIQNIYISKTLLLHVGYIYSSYRFSKRIFYEKENDSFMDLYYQKETERVELKNINEFTFDNL